MDPDEPPSDPFDPLQLTSEASLNRTRIAAVPGANRCWVGRPAFELLSMAALTALARRYGLGETASAADPVRELSRALGSQDQAAAHQALRVVAHFGRRLAHLIATLADPDERGVSAWRAAYLRHWKHVGEIWLGGGLAAALGASLVETVRAETARLGVGDRAIRLAPNAAVLPLIGAARRGSRAARYAVVLDFGHTAVKRGVATYTHNRLARLDALPEWPVRAVDFAGQGEAIVDFVLRGVADTIASVRERFGPPDRSVVLSLASYVVEGRPADPRSIYAPLSEMDRRPLEEEILRRTEVVVELRFVHDGTVAACGLPNPGRGGLIMLGTSLGAGFPPPPATLIPLDPDLLVTTGGGASP